MLAESEGFADVGCEIIVKNTGVAGWCGVCYTEGEKCLKKLGVWSWE